ncbi:DnaJ domain-containing protein [Skeletonema marinoi]|uniref:DnaJ domain-containing protein n=1 Tax=Skeletonema marinoi TaxID=267567 RepID=A0AAD8XZ82_9STRA|nr:DnaJ domain-containing protein [Skeletonema marinoi]
MAQESDNGAAASAESGSSSSESAKGSEEAPKKEEPQSPKVKQNNASSSSSSDDWGSFYDPNNIFCGKYDCYKILGFDYETWGSAPPTLKEITKSYRGLSRLWHPDKNKAKAYEILTNSESARNLTTTVIAPMNTSKVWIFCLWTYAPKSDASIIELQWKTGAPVKGEGIAILAENREKAIEAALSNGDTPKKKEKGPRLTSKEKREKEQLVNEIDDFGAGFRKPTYKDLLVIKMVKWPYYLGSATLWWSKYGIRRMRKLELNAEEREVLTKNAVGEVAWAASSDEERATMVTLELWVSDNLVEWREEQDMKRRG